MGQNLAGLGLTLDDIACRRAVEALDLDPILNDLRAAGVPSHQLTWLAYKQIGGIKRILILRDQRTNACQGTMLVEQRTTGSESFLAVDALIGGPALRAEAMLQRMLCFLILRLETMDERPAGILARFGSSRLCKVLHAIGESIPEARFHPAPEDRVIAFETAAFAHRLAKAAGLACRFQAARDILRDDAPAASEGLPALAVLDLRRSEEATVVEYARKLFRDRIRRGARTQAQAPRLLPHLQPRVTAVALQRG